MKEKKKGVSAWVCEKRLRRLFGSPAHAAAADFAAVGRSHTEKGFIKLCARRG